MSVPIPASAHRRATSQRFRAAVVGRFEPTNNSSTGKLIEHGCRYFIQSLHHMLGTVGCVGQMAESLMVKPVNRSCRTAVDRSTTSEAAEIAKRGFDQSMQSVKTNSMETTWHGEDYRSTFQLREQDQHAWKIFRHASTG